MAVLVWITTAVAIWHFTVLVPDRFWGGIAGALFGALVGGVISGAAFQAALGLSLGETSLATVFYTLPGCLLGCAAVYAYGVRHEEEIEV
ncbi:MAG TPA: hypothetical protein VIL04_06780 [Solirubrobacterales bacterium]|jgi:hypothetical protein